MVAHLYTRTIIGFSVPKLPRALHVATIPQRGIERAVDQLATRCERGLPLDDSANALAELLLAPFATAIEHAHHLIFVPYGTLHRTALHVLPWRGRPLAEQFLITLLPSASLLQFLVPAPALDLPRRAFVVGDPAAMAYAELAERQLPQLPGAGVEATYIAGLFPDSTVLLGSAATAEAVRRQIGGYPLVHFATHGFVVADAPLSAAVLLANGESLSAYDLMGMRLAADLVVLSACRTAEGRVTGGDEVIGLTRGLLAAGAQAVIVALWPVDDHSACLLMSALYRSLAAGESPARALQLAQNYLRSLSAETAEVAFQRLTDTPVAAASGLRRGARFGTLDTADTPLAVHNYSHPYHWAPYMLVGISG